MRKGVGTAGARSDHREVVEGGTRSTGVRRLQPERTAQDDVRGLVGPTPGRSPGVHSGFVGRPRFGRSRRADGSDRSRAHRIDWRPMVRQVGEPTVVGTADGVARSRHGCRADGRALAAGLSEDAQRTTSSGTEPRPGPPKRRVAPDDRRRRGSRSNRIRSGYRISVSRSGARNRPVEPGPRRERSSRRRPRGRSPPAVRPGQRRTPPRTPRLRSPRPRTAGCT